MTPFYDSTAGRMGMRVERGSPDVAVRYTTDGSRPTPASAELPDSITFGAEGLIRLQAFVGDAPMPARREFTLKSHLATGRPVTLRTPPSPNYPGIGPRTLTDGARGTTDLHDGLWQGWQGLDLDAIIDLGERRPLSSVEGSFLQDTRSWVLLPRSMRVWLSDDGSDWRDAGEVSHQEPAQRMDPFTYSLRLSLPAGGMARYVRVVAANAGPLPAWHPGAGHASWIFADEVVVR
jgi:hexosaminidase